MKTVNAAQSVSALFEREIFVYVPTLGKTESLFIIETQRVVEARKQLASKLESKHKTYKIDYQNYAFYKQNLELGFNGKYLDEETIWKEYLSENANFFEFRPIERIRCTNNLTKKQILKANDKSSRKKFERAVEKNYVKTAIKLLNKGMDPNFITEKGNTPLGIACEKRGTNEMILELIRNGANIHFRGKDGLTPLHRAAMHTNCEGISVLLRAGASPNYKDAKGLTPLYYSVSIPDPFPCWILLNCTPYCCDVNDIQSSAGETVLHLAAERGHLLQVKILLENGADVYAKTNMGYTPFHLAVMAGRVEIAKLLLENKLIHSISVDCDDGQDGKMPSQQVQLACSSSMEEANHVSNNEKPFHSQRVPATYSDGCTTNRSECSYPSATTCVSTHPKSPPGRMESWRASDESLQLFGTALFSDSEEDCIPSQSDEMITSLSYPLLPIDHEDGMGEIEDKFSSSQVTVLYLDGEGTGEMIKCVLQGNYIGTVRMKYSESCGEETQGIETQISLPELNDTYAQYKESYLDSRAPMFVDSADFACF